MIAQRLPRREAFEKWISIAMQRADKAMLENSTRIAGA